jgi:hypothetical protein
LMSQAKIVGGNEDVTLTIPGRDGFEMIVKANSVTFPDGTRIGPLVVSPVADDRLPMSPPGGGSSFMPGAAATIQPSGTRFDPPIEVRLPNTSGYAPGERVVIYHWDHDIGQYVAMGQATVTDDGAQLITDPGSGITKAGWHGPPTPPPCVDTGTKAPCSECAKLGSVAGAVGCPSITVCIRDTTKNGKKCGGDACKQCDGTTCSDKLPREARNQGDFKPEIASEEIFGVLNSKAAFAAYRTSSTAQAEWEMKLEPYCQATGEWKFKFSSLKIKPIIVKSTNWWIELAPWLPEQILGAQPAALRCRKVDGMAYELHSSSSSHYLYGNPALSSIAGAGWGAPGGLPYDQLQGIISHEKIHELRFKGYVSEALPDLAVWIDDLSEPIIDGDTIEAAKARISQRVDDLLTKFETAVIKLQVLDESTPEGSHSNPDDFYLASMSAIRDSNIFTKFAELKDKYKCSIR